MSIVLIMGSGPSVLEARSWDRSVFDHILAINNAYAVRPDWDSLIHPEDFPEDRRPMDLNGTQTIVTAQDYVPAQNQYGGFVYAGGTMAFTAGYWALAHHKPKVIAFIGCDMTYAKQGDTHFYGKGAADPLRDDVTLQSLEAKAARMEICAAEQGCALVNLSSEPSRLIFPRASLSTLAYAVPRDISSELVQRAKDKETTLDYFVPSGRYWEVRDQFDAAQLRALDALWLAAAEASRDT